MNDTEHLVRRYIATWNERDDTRRRHAVESVFAPDIRYTDPLADVVGADAIGAAIGAVQAQFPDFAFQLGSAIDAHHDTARFSWHLTSPYGGEPVAVGFDVVTIAEGRIGRVYGFLDKIPAVAESAG